ncbi:MAG: hypothetical protein LBI42_07260 [Chitinispirillales bacterium]|jgi:hypothetical protein|nr:hypothetical protein [Chitinispirillales bacterium]
MNHKFLAALICVSAFLMCQNSNVKDPVVKVGRITIGNESFEAFKKVARAYPAPFPHYFPSQRQPVSFMVECEAVYQFGKSSQISEKISSSLDWEWKKRFFAATLFFDIMGENLGFTDMELGEFYKKSPETFRVISQTADGQDSSFIPPFENIKRQVADQLFYEKYKPDSSFTERLGAQGQDSAALRNHWIYNARSNPPEFYMRRLYKEQYGEAYTDSVQQIYGEGKPIVSDDIDVIRSWVPENRRNTMRMKELVEWLLKWQLFSDYAARIGLASGSEYKEMLHWALRIDCAQQYLSQQVLPSFAPAAKESDTSLAALILFDQQGRIDKPDTFRLNSELENIVKTRINAKVDSVIHNIRKNVKVTWLQNDWRDDKDSDPALLIAKADSLKEASADADMDQLEASRLLEEAENTYRTLINSFVFTEEGRRAHNEMAKIQIDKYNSSPRQERYLLSSAINYYRKGQIFDSQEDNLCNSFFMIGFTYDEYLKNFALAEANYRWILQNSPACALVADAEFMMLHLDEPMTSIEEIQAQSLRQGRKIDFLEEEEGMTVADAGDSE